MSIFQQSPSSPPQNPNFPPNLNSRMSKKKKIIISSVAAVFLIVVSIVGWFTYKYFKPSMPKIPKEIKEKLEESEITDKELQYYSKISKKLSKVNKRIESETKNMNSEDDMNDFLKIRELKCIIMEDEFFPSKNVVRMAKKLKYVINIMVKFFVSKNTPKMAHGLKISFSDKGAKLKYLGSSYLGSSN
ncbi:hypothetical protein [Candidatus Phytoplasma meliae]|uniref:Uncharacterized protein n=1 Tax=Candidatus Phytoplasma meliae TaxID=1848402 RepID=A0ABS5CYA7_9MOLU|nr:hypothetical protein [Candidatus Phytoplasma meliae]MBP5835955.1 hypothetical protein [Candidatus Phytoplasma meliae]